ncbi:type II secretion system protein [Anaerolentibacter hominis]|uniref:type II secretion system protein n=1 Tax=Anaerolentibacter hominis TaxID=3079009 RepID=UPI0031B86564
MRKKGFTLIELIVCIAILGVVSSLVGMMITQASQSYRRTMARSDLQTEAQDCLNRISDLVMGGKDIQTKNTGTGLILQIDMDEVEWKSGPDKSLYINGALLSEPGVVADFTAKVDKTVELSVILTKSDVTCEEQVSIKPRSGAVRQMGAELVLATGRDIQDVWLTIKADMEEKVANKELSWEYARWQDTNGIEGTRHQLARNLQKKYGDAFTQEMYDYIIGCINEFYFQWYLGTLAPIFADQTINYNGTDYPILMKVDTIDKNGSEPTTWLCYISTTGKTTSVDFAYRQKDKSWYKILNRKGSLGNLNINNISNQGKLETWLSNNPSLYEKMNW